MRCLLRTRLRRIIAVLDFVGAARQGDLGAMLVHAAQWRRTFDKDDKTP